MTATASTNPSPLQRTRYVKSVKPPAPNMLKPGKNNKKLGNKITKGKWKGHPMYALTLEERNSCPTHCEQWDNCYGNNMPFALRYDHTHPDFYPMLEQQIASLTMKHASGFVIRLHVLGDFYSAEYVNWWRSMLKKYRALKIYGYTHHRSFTAIGYSIVKLNRIYEERCRVRFSDDTATYFSTRVFKGSPDEWHHCRTVTPCPEQLNQVKSCAECTLCWESKDKTIAFYEH